MVDEPPALLREGGFVRDGFDPALDELRSASREGKDWIANLQEREITRTGIKSLKVRFTSVFGYFIEITKANLPSVPEDYVRKQTTVNGERFITPELKEIENKILGAMNEQRLAKPRFFRSYVLSCQSSRRHPGDRRLAAALDALGSLAETARQLHYCRPVVDDSGVLEIVEGRHPILDFQSTGERFVPNDTSLDTDGHTLLPSSRGPTWRENPPTSGRWPCSRSWPRSAATCPHNPRKSGWSTASLPVWERATI